MAKSDNLRKAKKNKVDEFYTQLFDIENQLKHYSHHFKDKVVFCNCDDPYESNFFKFFAMNFNSLGLKKLIATCYDGSPVANTELNLFNYLDFIETPSKKAYKVEITYVSDLNNDGAIDLIDVELLLKQPGVVKRLNGNGDFRSDECIELLKKADIVCTNPPFSLFREYIAQLIEYNKKFIIIGNQNAIQSREIFPLFQANKIWLGYEFNNGNAFFKVPNNKIEYADGVYDEKTGLVKFRNCCWFTNLDINKRHEPLILYKQYSPSEYKRYYNYDGINVDKVSNIPMDYDGDMGVPITFLQNYNPEQFEIIGLGSEVPKTILHKTAGDEIHFIDVVTNEVVYKVPYTVSERKAGNSLRFDEDGKPGGIPFGRLIIRKKV